MKVDLLGPIVVTGDDGNVVRLSEPRVLCALMVLALHAPKPVATETLIKAAYGTAPRCGTEAKTVMGHVSKLRTVLGRDRAGDPYVPREPVGSATYRLLVEPMNVDLVLFLHEAEHLIRRSIDLPLQERLEKVAGLLGLWRGDPIRQHVKMCKTASALFAPARRWHRRVGELYVRGLLDSDDPEEADAAVDRLIDFYDADQELLELRAEVTARLRTLGASSTLVHPAVMAADYDVLRAQADLAIVRISAKWDPSATLGREQGIAQVVAEHARRSETSADALLRAVADRYPHSLAVKDLARQLWPNVGFEIRRENLTMLVRKVNANLEALASNQLPQFRIAVGGTGTDPGEIAGDEVMSLSSIDMASLLARSPAATGLVEPNLRVAWGHYDNGQYSAALLHFRRVADLMADGWPFNRSELALFFYYFAKCLLKLNLNEELEQLLDGPYHAFSTAVMEQLEPERLQIAGMLHRQMGNVAAAQACLDKARSELLALAIDDGPPVLWRTLADVEVLRAQPRLDQAVAPGPTLARQACVWFARQAVQRARSYLDRFGQLTGQVTHYEGRLGGTSAYVTIAESIVAPGDLKPEDWETAETNGRLAFQPERERKPVGIVVGRAALAAVKLAEASWWHRHVGEPADGEHVRRALQLALETLQIALDRWVPKVELGPRFETGKLAALQGAINELRVDPSVIPPPNALTPIL